VKRLILATRKSPLALAQAEMAAARLRSALGIETELLKLVTTGDRQAGWSLEKQGGKGLFTGELEQALLERRADVAVHSSKDLPGDNPEGLAVAGYLPRANPRDVLVIREGLARPNRIATGSPRRRQQIARLFPEAKFVEIRGNVDTRLRKVAELGEADATILAAAGLARLGIAGWPGLEFRPLDFSQMVPAVGQGAVALQCRTEDADQLAPALDPATAKALGLERAVQSALGGGCQTALGAHATADFLYFFHEKSHVRIFPLNDGELGRPVEFAARLLKALHLP